MNEVFLVAKGYRRHNIMEFQNAALRIAVLQSQKSVTPSDAHSLAIQQLAMMRWLLNQDLQYRQIADFRCDSHTAKSPSDGVCSSRVYCLEIAASMNKVFLVAKGCRTARYHRVPEYGTAHCCIAVTGRVSNHKISLGVELAERLSGEEALLLY